MKEERFEKVVEGEDRMIFTISGIGGIFWLMFILLYHIQSIRLFLFCLLIMLVLFGLIWMVYDTLKARKTYWRKVR